MKDEGEEAVEEVLYLNNNTAIRLVVYKGKFDYKNVKRIKHACSNNNVNVKDPVIDLDNGIVTHGVIEVDFDALGRNIKPIVLKNLEKYIYATHVTFLKDNDLTIHSRSWLFLGRPVLVIDASGIIASSNTISGSVLSIVAWDSLNIQQKLNLLQQHGLGINEAQTALRYLQSNQLTGVHLSPPPHCNSSPWGFVIVAKLFAGFPLTDKTLEVLMGKKISLQGFTKPTARLLDPARVLKAFAISPARHVW